MLGKGSIGRVYLVRHFKTNFYFALKKITKSEVKDINQFILGVKCHFFMNSPHIVQLYGCFSDSENIYLLMELCVDGNLAKEKKIMRHDEERNRVLLGIAKGVQSMHRNFIRHGDLKLENIMVSFVQFQSFRALPNSQISTACVSVLHLSFRSKEKRTNFGEVRPTLVQI